MEKLVKGIHHVALKCASAADFEKEKDFYGNVLGLKKVREWPVGVMFDTGDGIIEIFNNGEDKLPTGAIRHFAFATDDVDACIAAVKRAGCEVFIEPKDVDIPSDPVFPIRCAFCYGPLGEEVEFFQTRA